MKQPPALTESQLLAMPEAEYMNDAQLEFFRYRLLQWRQELLQNAATTGIHLKEAMKAAMAIAKIPGSPSASPVYWPGQRPP